MATLQLGKELSLTEVMKTIHRPTSLSFKGAVKSKVDTNRKYLENRLKSNPNEVIYGINTGFGDLCDKRIEGKDLHQLQYNLIRSHACGVGDEISLSCAKLMLLLKAQNLAFGSSGVRPILIEKLIFLYENNIIPVIYEKGSLGASGDLAPLAHLSLPLIGEGEVYYNGTKIETKSLVDKGIFEPVTLEFKEGISLLNGTQFMQSLAIHTLDTAIRYSKNADDIAAASLEAFDCLSSPFHELIQKVRPFEGQVETAKRINKLRSNSKSKHSGKEQVQDPYSFRCIPQVHGATKDVITHVFSIFEKELNSVTDNPLVFHEEDEILSGGNFHGQPLAMSLDYLAIAMAEIASISERRTYLLLSGSRGLPKFLVKNEGLNSGLMIAQYTAASVVSENKVLSHPASVDSIISSNGQEDHVSMGATAAVKAMKIAENVSLVLAIEALCSNQALGFKNLEEIASEIVKNHNSYRAQIPFIEFDEIISPLINATKAYLDGLYVE
jgi:histidine ammonia-lyase